MLSTTKFRCLPASPGNISLRGGVLYGDDSRRQPLDENFFASGAVPTTYWLVGAAYYTATFPAVKPLEKLFSPGACACFPGTPKAVFISKISTDQRVGRAHYRGLFPCVKPFLKIWAPRKFEVPMRDKDVPPFSITQVIENEANRKPRFRFAWRKTAWMAIFRDPHIFRK